MVRLTVVKHSQDWGAVRCPNLLHIEIWEALRSPFLRALRLHLLAPA